MNHVEARVVELVARLYPDAFAALERFRERHGDFVDETIGRFDREVQFYVAWLEHAGRLRGRGLELCLPRVSDRSKEVTPATHTTSRWRTSWSRERSEVVVNDFRLDEPERIIVVTGPNQGGKTTFARTFGQLHHLAASAARCRAREARLFLFDRLFTHFERQEDIDDLQRQARGRARADPRDPGAGDAAAAS